MTTNVLEIPPKLPTPDERRRLREGAGLSGSALAAQIGVAPATVYGWESGREPRGLLREAYATALQSLAALRLDTDQPLPTHAAE